MPRGNAPACRGPAGPVTPRSPQFVPRERRATRPTRPSPLVAALVPPPTPRGLTRRSWLLRAPSDTGGSGVARAAPEGDRNCGPCKLHGGFARRRSNGGGAPYHLRVRELLG